jgi:biopolymer transport protein ExbD
MSLMQKKGLLKSRKQSDEMALQITSMADIFTILLVFLLKSYTTGAMSINPSKGVSLPAAMVGEANIEALKIEISDTAVEVEGKSVATLEHYQFAKEDIEPNGASNAVNHALETERKRQVLIAQSNSDVKVDSKIIVVADQHVPYSTIKTVLASAALQGYTDFKLAVVRGE